MDLLHAIGEMADKALPVNIPEVGLTIGAGNEFHAVREVGKQQLEVLIGNGISSAFRLPGCRLDFEAELPFGMLAHRLHDEPRCPPGIVPLDPAVKAVNERRPFFGV